ncbi:MAG: prolipoprotein diacylglyceryl transferase [Lachnospiraceae bacterium]|nr:prolipoprotein diacylglyceryl transferase [Lachnospiraceae bacterium]
MDINFINLGFGISDLQKTFSVFGFEIAYYGLIIGIGMICGVCIAMWDAKKRGQDPDLYLDFALYAIIISVIGARIYYVAFAWDSYKDNLLEIVNIRNGGLAIYGGVIAAVLTLIVYARVKKQSMLSMADTGVLGLILGQAIGRWGNFVNCEAFGGYTDSLLAMRLNVEHVNSSMISNELWANRIVEDGITYIQVHPTFLYESLWNLMVLAVLLMYRKHKKFNGEVFFMYLFGYGLGRAWIEGMRTDQLLLWGTDIAVSQLLAIVLVVVSAAVIIAKRAQVKKLAAVGGAVETAMEETSAETENSADAEKTADAAEKAGETEAVEEGEEDITEEVAGEIVETTAEDLNTEKKAGKTETVDSVNRE